MQDRVECAGDAAAVDTTHHRNARPRAQARTDGRRRWERSGRRLHVGVCLRCMTWPMA